MKYRPVRWRVGEQEDYQQMVDAIYICEEHTGQFYVACSIYCFSKSNEWMLNLMGRNRTADFVKATRHDTFGKAAEAAERAYKRYAKQGAHHD